jgi:parallel beta helix pectate lyase-like protein
VRDSVATGNTGAGFNAPAGDLNLENCEASNNRDGVVASSTSTTTGTVTISNCLVTNNAQSGFLQDGGGVFQSRGNNTARRNGTNMSDTINVISGN